VSNLFCGSCLLIPLVVLGIIIYFRYANARSALRKAQQEEQERRGQIGIERMNVVKVAARNAKHTEDVVMEHEKQQEAKRATAKERVAERERALFIRNIEDHYPFIPDEKLTEISRADNQRDTLKSVLEALPAIHIGKTVTKLPAVIPIDTRRKPLYVVGRSGSGKSTLLYNIIKADLEEGRGMGTIAPEQEMFRDWVLPLVPEHRAPEVIYFAPGNPDCPLTFNPLALEEEEYSDPHAIDRAAGEILAIFKRIVGGRTDIGIQAGPIIANVFGALVARRGSTLLDVARVIQDKDFRQAVAADVQDEQVRYFLTTTFDTTVASARMAIVNRLDDFLRPLVLRRALCNPVSSFSIRQAMEREHILLFDLSGLAPGSLLLLGQLLLAKVQLELMRREKVPEHERKPFYIFADEFQTFAGTAKETWQLLLSRGRRFGLALTLAHQFPSQIPDAVLREIFGNLSGIVCFNVLEEDAQVIRRRLLKVQPEGKEPQPYSLESIVRLKTPGEAIVRLVTGACALRVTTDPPPTQLSRAHGERIRDISWDTYGAPAPQEDATREKTEPPLDYPQDDDPLRPI